MRRTIYSNDSNDTYHVLHTASAGKIITISTLTRVPNVNYSPVTAVMGIKSKIDTTIPGVYYWYSSITSTAVLTTASVGIQDNCIEHSDRRTFCFKLQRLTSPKETQRCWRSQILVGLQMADSSVVYSSYFEQQQAMCVGTFQHLRYDFVCTADHATLRSSHV